MVPASHIKVPGQWQSLPLPYIIHFPVSAEINHTYDALQPLKGWKFYQISCFADSYSAAKAIAAAVKAVLGHATLTDGTQTFWGGDLMMPYESDIGIQQIASNYEVWESL